MQARRQMGGTMRLGTRTSHFKPGMEWSKLRAMYGGADVIEERHRHRYEVNPEYIEELEKAGLSLTSFDEPLPASTSSLFLAANS